MEKSEQARSFKEIAKKYIPFALQKKLYSIVKKARHIKNIHSSAKFNKEYFKSAFRQAGIKKGDIVLLHSSLGRIGLVEGGADAVIDALLEIISKKGTLVIPAFSGLTYDKRQKMHVFDLQNTPSYTGIIPETFRKRYGVVRSLSPTHSLCAAGKKAKELVKGHENCDNPFALNGPFGRLYEWNARILLLAVDHLANSSLHIVEDYPDFPVKVFTEKFKVLVIDGKKRKVIEARRHTDHSRRIRDPNLMERYCLKYGVMKIVKVGRAELRIIEAKRFVDMMHELAKKNITIYPISA